MKEQDFEQLLYQEANHLTPEEFSSPLPTPWRSALKQLCWGLTLPSITLNFLYLDCIFPTLGGVLVWLGFPTDLLTLLPNDQVAQLDDATHIQVTTQTSTTENADLSQLSMDIVEIVLMQTGDIRVYAFGQPIHLSLRNPAHYVPQWYPYADIIFSLPKGGEHMRGYVTWTLHGFTMATNFNAKVVYLHQNSPFLYPWATPGNQYRNNSLANLPFAYLDRPLLIQYPDTSS